MKPNVKSVIITFASMVFLLNFAIAQTISKEQMEISDALREIDNRIYDISLSELRSFRERSDGDYLLVERIDMTNTAIGPIVDSSKQLQILADFYVESSPLQRQKAIQYIKLAMLVLNPQNDILDSISLNTPNQELRNIIKKLQNERYQLRMQGLYLESLIN